MSLAPLLTADPVIQFHAIGALCAVALGPVAIYRKRRDMIHRVVGYIWVLAMVTTAVSSFWILEFAVIGPFSPIHGLAVLALWSIWVGMRAIWRGDLAAHKATMRSLYWNGVMIAALFNFLPGRRVNRSVFGEHTELGLYVVAIGGTLLVLRLLSGRKFMRRLA